MERVGRGDICLAG